MSIDKLLGRGCLPVLLSILIAATSTSAWAVPDAPLAEDPPIAKIRYISFTPGNAGKMVALRVTLTHLECGAGDGHIRWVGPPSECNDMPSSLGTFRVSRVQCTPHYQDWGDVGLLHVTSASNSTDEVGPGSIYAVQAIEQGDSEGSESSYSDPLVVFTVQQNDSVGRWDGTKWSPPDGVVSVHEIVAGWMTFGQEPEQSLGKVRIAGYDVNPCGLTGFSTLDHYFWIYTGSYESFCPTPNVGSCPGSALFACGNGALEPGEECDDSNTAGGDGCSGVCLFEPDCGNGRMEVGEACDDGNTTPGDGCDANCRGESVCGNGLIELDEECDDGGVLGGDGCDAECRAETRTAVLSMAPLRAGGGNWISGQTVGLDASEQMVWIISRLRDWDPDLDSSVRVEHFSVELDPDGMRAGEPEAPHAAQIACAPGGGGGSDYCRSVVGLGNSGDSNCLSIGLCNVVVDPFEGGPELISFFAGSYPTISIKFAGSQITQSSDAGVPKSLGEFVLNVPDGAFGSYTIDALRGYNQTIFLDQNLMPIPLAAVEPATVQVPVANRFLPFAPSSTNVAGGEPLGVRVKILSMPQFPGAEGTVRWASAPASHADSIPSTTFFASALQCDPITHDWSGIDAVYLYGAEVVPGSTYEIRTATASCIALGEESCLSKAVTVITTPKWCDVAFPMGGVGQPNFGDISAVIGAFQGQATGLVKARAKVQPRVPNPAAAVDFSDISATVAAFQTGGAYPYAGPDACP